MKNRQKVLGLTALAVAAAALSACGGGGSVSAPPPVTPSFASTFGAGFGTDFAAPGNSTPAPISGNELNPVTLTGTPTPFPAGVQGTN